MSDNHVKLPPAIKDIAFEEAVQIVFGTQVQPFEREEKHKLIELLDAALANLCIELNQRPIEHTRVNEVGNKLEPHVVHALREQGIDAEPAKTRSGRSKANAYPDVSFDHDGERYYLEVKSFAAASVGTNFRSFYMSPSEDPKIFVDACHLVVGFEMLDQGPTGEVSGGKALHAYIPQAYEIADLYGMKCDLKMEFNSNNLRMYEKDRVLVRKRVS